MQKIEKEFENKFTLNDELEFNKNKRKITDQDEELIFEYDNYNSKLSKKMIKSEILEKNLIIIEKFFNDEKNNVLSIISKQANLSSNIIFQYLKKRNKSKWFEPLIFDNSSKFMNNLASSLKNSDKLFILYLDSDFMNNFDLKYYFSSIKDSKLILIFDEDYNTDYFLSKDKEILKYHDKEYVFYDLNDESKQKLVNLHVNFQNKIVMLKDLLEIDSLNFLPEDFLSCIDLNIFNSLIKIACFDENTDTFDKYYIERKFFRYVQINEEIFNTNRPNDIIILKENEFIKTRKLNFVKFNEVIPNSFDYNSIVLIPNELQFDSFCQLKAFANKNVHFLDFNENHCVHQKSKGKIDFIKKFILNEDSNMKEYHDDFFNEIYKLNESVIILSGEAGMGKSAFLNKLYQNLCRKSENNMIFKIDLSKCLAKLNIYEKRLKTDKDFINNNERAFGFILDLGMLKTKFEKAIFKYFYEQEKKIIFLFDGLDETSWALYHTSVLDILKCLKKNKIKILITTRPNLKEELENNFGTISFSITKLTFENQLSYLSEYLKLNEPERILKGINDNELTSNPLQLRLFSEIYLNEFEQNEFNIRLMYDKYVEKKFYDIYCREKKNLDTNDPQISSKYHIFL